MPAADGLKSELERLKRDAERLKDKAEGSGSQGDECPAAEMALTVANAKSTVFRAAVQYKFGLRRQGKASLQPTAELGKPSRKE